MMIAVIQMSQLNDHHTQLAINSSRYTTFHQHLLKNQVNPKQVSDLENGEIPFDDNDNPEQSRRAQMISFENLSPEQNPTQTYIPPIQSFSFLKVIMQRRLVNEFKELLLYKAGIISRNMHTHILSLLQERYLRDDQIQNIGEDSRFYNKIPLFQPQSKFILLWEFLQFLQILFITWWGPFLVAFQPSQSIFSVTIEQTIIYYSIIDMIIKFNRSIIVQGQILLSRDKIIIHYIKSELALDSVSILILFLLNSQNDLHPDVVFDLISVVQVYVNWQRLQLMLLKLQESFEIQDEAIDLGKVLLAITYFAHISACIWHKTGVESEKSCGISWISKQGLESSSLGIRYNYSLYWATMTMVTVGYGDVTQSNFYEMLVSNIIMILACTMFGFSMNSIGIILKNLNDQKQRYRKIQIQMNQYMNKNLVNHQIKSKVRNYLKFYSEQDNLANDQEVTQLQNQIYNLIQQLSPSLKSELLYDIQSKPLQYCNFLNQNFSSRSLKEIIYQMESHHYTPQEGVFIQDQQDDCCLFIVVQGEVSLKDDKTGLVLKTIKRGEYFGELEMITGSKRSCSAYSKSFSHLYKISRKSLLNILNSSVIDTERFHLIKDSIMLNSNYELAHLNCYSCHKFTHFVTQCPYLQYHPDIESLIKRENFSSQARSRFRRKHQQKSAHTFKDIQVQIQINKVIAEEWQKQYETTIKDDEEQSSEQILDNSLEVSNSQLQYHEMKSKKNLTSASNLDKPQESLNVQKTGKTLLPYKSERNLDAFTYKRKGSLNDNFAGITSSNTNQENDTLLQNGESLHSQSINFKIDQIVSYQLYYPEYNLPLIIAQYSKYHRIHKSRLKMDSANNYTYNFKAKRIIYKNSIQQKIRRQSQLMNSPVKSQKKVHSNQTKYSIILLKPNQ